MGIFDFFKSKRPQESAPLITENAHRVNCTIAAEIPSPHIMSEEEYETMRQENIGRLELTYNFSSIAGINAIPGPSKAFKENELQYDFTGRVEYYLLSKAEQYITDNNPELAIACFRKAMDLMPMYGDFYPREQYMRLPRYLRKLRRFDEARAEESRIQQLFHGEYQYINELYWPERRKRELISLLERLGGDLVLASYVRCCCSECAKYRGRVYSYSGQDARFPKLPAFLLDNQHNCGISFSPFIMETSSFATPTGLTTSESEIIHYSNRPFVDDRTLAELSDWKDWELKQSRKEAKELARKDYDWLWEFLPDICPKSFSAYMRIKNSQTEKFLTIAAAAAKHGRKI